MTSGRRVPSDEPLDAAPDRGLAPLLRPELPAGFARTVTVLPPGEHCSLSSEQWRDALVVITRGLVAVTTTSGAHAQFSEGSIVALGELSTGDLTNVGDTDAVLVAVVRKNKGDMATGSSPGQPG